MKYILSLLLLSSAMAQELSHPAGEEVTSEFDGRYPEVTPQKYAKQAQEEREENEKEGLEIRKNMRKASGLNRGDPRLRGEEPYNQAGKIMRPE